MDLDEILLTCEDGMDKAVAYLTSELKGVRTGRATTALVDFVKVDCYGSMTDLRSIAQVSVPEPTQLLIKPFDPGTLQSIVKAIQSAGLGLNPMSEGKQIRVSLPPLSGDRRKQLAGSVKQMGEQAKIAIRNVRRDSNKHLEQAAKDKASGIGEDQAKHGKDEIQKLTDQHEKKIDELLAAKTREILEV